MIGAASFGGGFFVGGDGGSLMERLAGWWVGSMVRNGGLRALLMMLGSHRYNRARRVYSLRSRALAQPLLFPIRGVALQIVRYCLF